MPSPRPQPPERDVLLAALLMRLEALTSHSPELGATVTKAANAAREGGSAKDLGVLVDLLVDVGWLTERDGAALERRIGDGSASGDPERTVTDRDAANSSEVTAIDVGAASGGRRNGAEARARTAFDASAVGSGAIHGEDGDDGPTIEQIPVDLIDVDERYATEAIQGVGGLGRVHRARDHVLRRRVALKEIKPSLADHQDAKRRLLREVQITAQLEHPGIVPIYDLARRDGRLVYTMRLVRGQTLKDAIQAFQEKRSSRTEEHDPLALRRLLGAFVSLCNAIAYAHSRGVIHRDLKPDNVVLGQFGDVVLLDWGLAKLVSERTEPLAPVDDVMQAPEPGGADGSTEIGVVELTADARIEHTAVGLAMGTPAYMAPEQARGELGAIGIRTDIYGLGGVLFEILTGRGPHAGGETDEVLTRIVSLPTPRARALDHRVDPALDAICARAMAKEPDERYESAAALAEDIQRFLADEPVEPYAEPLGKRVGRWMRKHRSWTAAAAAALLITILVTSVSSVLLAGMARRERQSRIDTAHVAVTFAARTVATEMDRRWQTLELAAADDELLASLRELKDRGSEPGSFERVAGRLVQWIRRRHRNEGGAFDSKSWFVTDSQGHQVARSPHDPTVVGRDFAFRDYFHGQGRDLEEGERPQPIGRAHQSVVFRSQARDHKLMVAFSIPVVDAGETLGVLAMTVEIGQFGALDLDVSGQVVVLVDTTPDWIEGRPATGLIVHHPIYNEAVNPGVLRLSPDRVEALRKLREERMRPGSRSRNWLAGSFDSDYVDPAAGSEDGASYAGSWLAAFEPVVVQRKGESMAQDTGWVVIVQERPDGP